MSILPLLALLLGLRVAISDLYARRVPNLWLGIALVGAALWRVQDWAFGSGTPPWPNLGGLALGLAALLPFHLLRMMGAGDVKYFAVIGFLLGWQALLPIWVVASLLAGLHAACILLVRSAGARLPALQLASMRLQSRMQVRPWWQAMHSARSGRVGIPYAAYLAAGTFCQIFMLTDGWPA